MLEGYNIKVILKNNPNFSRICFSIHHTKFKIGKILKSLLHGYRQI